MPSETDSQRVLDLAGQRGLLRVSELDAITRLSAAGLLERLGRGLYRLPGLQVSEFERPRHCRCESATGRVLPAYSTSVPRAAPPAAAPGLDRHATRQPPPRIDYPPIKMVQFTGEAFSAGVEEVERGGVRLRVYCVAKTVGDCFKHRSKIGLDIALEVLEDARSRNKASVEEIWRYAKACRVANVMRPCLESIG